MNNWRLLLLAVIAVLQPIPSFTEGNLIDGRRECCDHRSNSIAPDIRLYGTFSRSSFEDRRLVTRDFRSEQRQEAKYETTRSRERLALERTERLISPLSTARSSTDSRFASDQERRSHNIFEIRDGVNRRIYDTRSSDKYERDVVYSRRVRMSREDIRRDIDNEPLYRDSRRVRTSEELRRDPRTKETMAVFRRENNDVTRGFIQRDSRFNTVTRLQLDNTRGRRTLAVRGYNEIPNRISRSIETRVNSDNEREERRNLYRTTFESVDGERRQDQRRELSDRTYTIRHSFEQRLAERKHDGRSQERSSLNRISNLSHVSAEQRQGPVEITRQSRELQLLNARFSRPLVSNARFDERRETSENIPRLSRNTATEREERLARHLRDVRSVERLDRSRERENTMFRDPSTSMLRETRNYVQRTQEARSLSSSRSDRETRIRNNERNDMNNRKREERRVSREQIFDRKARDSENRRERESIMIARRPSSVERISRYREVIANNEMNARNVRDTNRDSRDKVDAQNIRDMRSRTSEDSGRRDMNRERDEIRLDRRRISSARLSRERIEERRREARENTRDSRVDTRRDVTRNRGDVRMEERFEVRREYNNIRVHRDWVALQQSPDMRAVRLLERGRDLSVGRIRLSYNRNDRRITKRSSNERDIRVTRSESRQMEERDSRANRSYLAVNRIIRLQAKVESTNIREAIKNLRSDTRSAKRESTNVRLQNFESAKTRDINPSDETSEWKSTMNWQLVFYTLQGAYLCGLLMKVLTEKTNKGKSRKFTWWMTPKNLVKAD